MNLKHKTVLVFGVFDGLHEGHRNFLDQARLKATKLLIVLAPDEVVKDLKGKLPFLNLNQRIQAIREFLPESEVIVGDTSQGKYSAILIHRPDIICLGYDQERLKLDLMAKMAEGKIPRANLVVLEPFRAETYKSSILALRREI